VRRKDNDVVLISRLKLTLFLHGLPLFGWDGLDFMASSITGFTDHGLHGMTEKEGNVQYKDSRGGRNVSEVKN
jgi:hypothetical protein